MGLTMYVENSNMEEFLRPVKFLMTIIGVWPLGNSKYKMFYYSYGFIISYFSTLLFTLSIALFMLFNLDNVDEVVNVAFYFLTQAAFILKFFYFTYKRHVFLQILDFHEEPIFFEKHKIYQLRHVESWSYFVSRFCIIYYILCYSIFCNFSIIPLFDDNIILPMQAWFPFDIYNNQTNRNVAYFFELIGYAISVTMNVSLDLMPAVFMCLGCAQLEILKENLKLSTKQVETILTEENGEDNNSKDSNCCELFNEEQNNLILNILRDCILHHEAVISYLKLVEELFYAVSFIQFVTSSISICFTVFQIVRLAGEISYTFVTTIVYLLAILGQIALYCFSGNEVIEQSKRIGESCYNMEWYRCNKIVKKVVFIIMEKCKIPITLSAGKFFVMSIHTLTTILKSSYSYLTVLLRMYNE